MAFSARHYTEVARIIRETNEHVCSDADMAEGWHGAVSSVRLKIRAMFAADNPRFDATRFDMACEPKERT